MKYQAMEYRGPEVDVRVLGVIEATTPGAAIRKGVTLWPHLHADNFFLKLKDWTTWEPKRETMGVKPIMSAPQDDPYG